MRNIILVLLFVILCVQLSGVVITQWDFEAQALNPSTGTGSLSLIGNITNDGYNTGYNSTWALSTTNYPAQSTNNLTAGVYFELSTVGYNNITLSWSLRHSNTSANRAVLYYTLDKTASDPVWQQAGLYDATNGDTWFQRSFDGSSIGQLGSNPNLAFKIVSSFANIDNTAYVASKSTSTYAASGKWRFDNIIVEGTPVLPVLEITSSLTHFYALVDRSSAIQSYTVNGYNMASNLVIDAPHYFEIRLQGMTTFMSSLSIRPSLGTISSVIEVQYHPTITGDHMGMISHTGSGFTTQDLPVSGSTVLPEPSTHITDFTASDITYYQLLLHWVDSQGAVLPDGYIIKGSKIHPDSIAFPVDGVVEESKKLTKYVSYGVQTALIWELGENRPYYFKIFPYTNNGAAIDYKTDDTIPTLAVLTSVGPIGTTLSAGDIAFVEYGSDSPDRFAFILLRDIAENTQITFTDQPWDGNMFLEGEVPYFWRGVARSYNMGEVIHIVEDTLYTDEGIINPNFTEFSNSGDQIIAYQGEASTPTFLAAFSTTGWISSGIPTNNSSYLPTALTLGATALGFPTEIDNGYYNSIVSSGSPIQMREAINDPANWVRENSASSISYPLWNLTVFYEGVSDINISKIDTSTSRISWTGPVGASSYRLYTSNDYTGIFPGAWQLIQSGIINEYVDIPMGSISNRGFYRITAVY